LATILKGGILVELEPASVDLGDLRVEGGHIAARDRELTPGPSDQVVELGGRVVMPGLVCAHHHLYSALARGAPAPAEPPENFLQILERIWWRLDIALDLDAVELSAMVGALDALRCGTTTIFDHHASPSAISGSLLRVARGISQVGLRGVLAYEVTDRHGAAKREEGLEETVNFQKAAEGRFRGMIGAHASFTISPEGLEGLRDALEATGAGLHIHLAEDGVDQRLSLSRYGATPVERLSRAGLLRPNTLLAHAVHLSWPELSSVISSGAWLIHNARSNMNNQVGYAPTGRFGARAALGTDGIDGDLLAESQLAYFRSREAGQPIELLKYLANGHRLASEIFGTLIGPLQQGAAADLMVLDYHPPTPLSAETLAEHLLFGFSSKAVEAVMVDGIWRMWDRRPISVRPEAIAEHARETARAVWSRMTQN
jgi:putative selenium metabolism protein SsnA